MQSDVDVRAEAVTGNVCCCCLSTSNLSSLLLTYYYNGQSEIYANMIFKCFCIQLITETNNVQEYMICNECISRLREAFSFRLLVEIAQKTLQKGLIEEKECTSKKLDLYFHDVDLNFDDDFLTNEEDINCSNDIIKKTKPHTARTNESEQKCDKVEITQTICETPGENSKIRKRPHKKVKLDKPKDGTDILKCNINETFKSEVDNDNNEEYCNAFESQDTKLEDKSEKQKKNSIKETKKNSGSGKLKVEEKPYKLNKNDLTCKICNETFPWHTTLERHMSVHFPNHICHICARFFTKKSNLMTHVLRHKHSQDVHTCDVCKKQYKGAENLRNHMRYHISPTGIYKCPQCPVRFSSYYKRVKHLIDVHDDEAKKYKCKHCSKRYYQSCTLSRHIKAVHLQERRHVCQKCGNSFFDKSGLVEHMLKHTGIKNFHCEICTKSYGRRFTLTEHMKIHNNVKNYVCHVCNRAFTQKCTLKGHMKVHEKVQVKMPSNEDV
ncbi:uncharacterized protein LOC143918007 [Arctopsyche grandis]|uniref:uncharacterized protein LOC143918007 n=1 Tax=Arctopsyche grandis TaxID=121162 RepID=UPI00406D7A9B